MIKRSALSFGLLPFSLVFAAIQILRRILFTHRAHRASIPLISIGNITCGGSGKTPVCIKLARLLQSRGLKVGISHRGYKGSFEHLPTIIATDKEVLPIAVKAGDEAYLLAKNLPKCPVVTGKDRKAAIELLQKTYPKLDLIILDDSFQHLKLKHDIDILVFDAAIGLGNGFVLPAGYLREPLNAIKKQHLLLIFDKNGIDPSLEPLLRKHSDCIFKAGLQIKGCYDSEDKYISISEIKDLRLVSVCGIAHPAGFAKSMAALDLSPLHSFEYPDHYAYEDLKEIKKLESYCDANNVHRIICTEKDIMKLKPYAELRNRLLYLKVEAKIEDEDALATELLGRLADV